MTSTAASPEALGSDGRANGRGLELRDVQREMCMMHRTFRREFSLAPSLVRAVPDGESARVSTLTEHLRLMLKILELHHHGEDELIWPLLTQRAPADARLVATMEAQHAVVGAAIGGLEGRLAEWQAAASAKVAAQVAAAIERMHLALVEHLDLEEARVVPLISEHLSAKEWARLGEHGMKGAADEDHAVVLGMFLEDMPDDDRAVFLDQMPPPVAQMLATAGADRYAAYVAEVRQPA